jgi:hypothetical protein
LSKRKYTEQELREAVASSASFRQVLSKLSLREAGGNYKSMRRMIEEFKIDCDHFTGQGHLKGKKNLWHPITPLEDILVDGSYYQSFKLKNRLLKSGMLEKRCYMDGCNITEEWNGKPINLRLDHINGKNDDNRLENLRLLCPNCDSQLETFCGRNKRKKVDK